jgi:hypothetical protein
MADSYYQGHQPKVVATRSIMYPRTDGASVLMDELETDNQAVNNLVVSQRTQHS